MFHSFGNLLQGHRGKSTSFALDAAAEDLVNFMFFELRSQHGRRLGDLTDLVDVSNMLPSGSD